jgi:hypothetical protein
MFSKKTSTLFGTPVTMIIPKTFFIADFFCYQKITSFTRVPAGQTISAASPNIWLRR